MLNQPQNIFHYFEHSVQKYPDNIAIICNEFQFTYQELSQHINKISHYFITQGIQPGDYVCILLNRSHINYICMLALFKIGAIYVPIDPKYPRERIDFIIQDLNAQFLITEHQLHSNISIQQRLEINTLQDILLEYSHEPSPTHQNIEDCYVIYTSGTTGNPKGVSISHQNICHYVQSASKVYQITSNDRIYQGFSLSFDASMEEVWMAFVHGATLVTCTSDDVRAGVGLTDFLIHHQITVLSTVPSLLSTLDHHIPKLRLIILGGETCHYQQIKAWFSPQRRIINSYGPTEATVVSTISELNPNESITIGKALPGYETMVIDENLNILANGEIGELCIGGAAISKGYINLPELTNKKFIQHPIHPSQRIYRTGDLVKLNNKNQIEFLGRMDDQVKLRGFRIELNEIEVRMCQIPGIIQAVANVVHEPTPMLIAYYELDKNNPNINNDDIIAFLNQKLPSFMIPNHFEKVKKFPLLASGKINKKALPKINSTLPNNDEIIEPHNDTEKLMVDIWTEVFKTKISTHHHFFFDLGGHSLFAAQVISKLRKHPGFEKLSIKDLYQFSTIQSLAQQFKLSVHTSNTQKPSRNQRYIPSNLSYTLTSIGQFLGALLSYSIHTWPFLLLWIYLQHQHINPSLQFGYFGIFLAAYPLIGSACMIGIKWLLLGKVKPGKYPLWGFDHYRIWLFHCIEKNFLYVTYFYGTPFISLYLKCMGAKIGKNVYIGNISRKPFSLIYDLLEIGENSNIGLDAQICTQYIKDGYLHLGPIHIGRNCYVGNRALLKPYSIMKDNSYLDEMASLQEFSIIQSEQFYSGSPAKSVKESEHLTLLEQLKTNNSSTLPYPIFCFLSYLSIITTSFISSLGLAFTFITSLYCYQYYSPFLTIPLLMPALTALGILFQFGLIKISLFNTYSKLTKGKYAKNSIQYLRYWWDATLLLNPQVSILSDTLFAQYIFRFFGMKVGKGCEIGGFFLTPIDLVEMKDEAFIASSPSLAWPRIHNGIIYFDNLLLKKNCFIGNWSYIRNNETIGEETLIGVTSITPDHHQAEKNQTGWVGLPPIFLPKRQAFNDIPESLTRHPSRKLIWVRGILETIRIILPSYLMALSGLMIYFVTQYVYHHTTPLKTLIYTPILDLMIFISMVGSIVGFKWILIGRLKPTIKPLWSTYIWKYDMIEYLFISYINPIFVNFFIGSIFFNIFLRAMGCQIGEKVYMGTLLISEFDLIKIGSHSSIDDSTLVQCHLYEDRIYKTSQILIDDSCNIGISATILYDTKMESHSSLGDKSLLMKGETLSRDTQWLGSPAQYYQPISTYEPVAGISEEIIDVTSS